MLARIYKAVSNNIRSKLSFSAKLRSVGLSWVKIKWLKNVDSPEVKQHKLFGQHIHYIKGNDLLHSLLELFIDEIYKTELGPSPYIIDCGANIGLSIIYLKRRFPDATILAFEPDRNNFPLLRHNVTAFGFNGVELRQEAIWKEAATLQFRSVNSLASSIETDAHPDSYSVQAIRLRDILVSPVDFLKMDIEGAEFAVLTDIADRLHLIKSMFIEYHGSFAQQQEMLAIFDIIDKAGFRLYIREAHEVYPTPLLRSRHAGQYDVQLNIFCFRVS